MYGIASTTLRRSSPCCGALARRVEQGSSRSQCSSSRSLRYGMSRHGDRVAHPTGTHPSQSVNGTASARLPSSAPMSRELQVTTSVTEDRSAACLRTISRVVSAAERPAYRSGSAWSGALVRCPSPPSAVCAVLVYVPADVPLCGSGLVPVGAGNPSGARLDHDLPLDHEVNQPATLCLRWDARQVRRACRPLTRTLGTASIATPLG
jgi:hypothetical protein